MSTITATRFPIKDLASKVKDEIDSATNKDFLLEGLRAINPSNVPFEKNGEILVFSFADILQWCKENKLFVNEIDAGYAIHYQGHTDSDLTYQSEEDAKIAGFYEHCILED